MASHSTKNATLFAAQEAAEGTAEDPVANDAILAAKITAKFGQEMHERPYQGAPGTRDLVPGAMLDNGVSFETEIKANGSDNTPEIDELLQAVFGQVAAGAASTEINGGASTTTSLVVDDSTGFTAGNMVEVEVSAGVFEISWISAVPDGTHISITPALTAAPSDNADVKEMRTFQIASPTSLANSLTIDRYWTTGAGTSKRDRFVGCRGNVKMQAVRAGSIPMLAWEFLAWSWTRVTSGTRPTPNFDSALPKTARDSKFRVNGSLVHSHGHEWDLGAVLSKKTSNNSSTGICGIRHVDYQPKGKFVIHEDHDSIAEFTALSAGSTMSLIQQFGSSVNGTWGWYCPRAVRSTVELGDDEGNVTDEISWSASTQNDASPTVLASGPAQFYLGVG